ncbi:MAG: FtsQ-type POTRA domain-containing protein [Syntrophorhabdales bacterium]|jgi:cell division protein FtsQ
MKRTLYLLFIVPMGLLTVLTAMYLFSRTEPLFLLKNIRIKGADQLPESEILTKIYPFLKDSIFGTDMGKVKEAIISHPFVRDVRVKRVFPFSILIEVKERVPSALWVGPEGDVQMLDEDGVRYRSLRKGETRELVVISAKKESDARDMFREVSLWDRQGIIKKDDLSEVVYDEGQITLFSLNDGVEIILGKEERPERLKRAMAVLDDAKKRGLLIRCIDARFEDGAIIQERKG